VWSLAQTITSDNSTGYNPQAGSAVAISSDATVVAYGEAGQYESAGLVQIYTGSSGSYSSLASISPSDGIGYPEFGSSLAFCNGSDVLVVGGSQDNSGIGAVWVFVNQSGTYTQVAKLVGSGGTGWPSQGETVSVTSDCSTIAVGGPFDSSSTGAVWIFVSSGSNTWSQQGSKLTGSNPSRQPRFSTSLSLSGDGNRLAVGGPTNNYSGAVWIFDRVSGSWSQTAYIRFTTVPVASQEGRSVYLAQNGTTLLIGCSNDLTNVGSVRVFTYSGSSWVAGSIWNPSGGGAIPNAGYRLVASGNERTFLVGAPLEQYSTGAAYVLVA
jgi:hypothetical protein